MLRDRIADALAEAMQGNDAVRISTLRLMWTAVRDREIALRSDDGPQELPDAEVIDLLLRMIRQREASITTFEQSARMEMAEQERTEIAIIRDLMPRPLSEEEVAAAVQDAILRTRANSIRDMGRVMALLKRQFPGRMDYTTASTAVKAALG
jgi:hypothetical protein